MAYLRHVNRLLQNAFDVDPAAEDQVIEQFRENLRSSSAELEVLLTLSTNRCSPKFVPTGQVRTPDLETCSSPRLAVEVTTSGPTMGNTKRDEFIECLVAELQQTLVPHGLLASIDVRRLETLDVQNLARRVSSGFPAEEGTFVVGADEETRRVPDDPFVDLVEAESEAICVVHVSSRLSMSPVRAEDVSGTSLESALRGKLRRRQVMDGCERIIVVDLTQARHQLMGGGFARSLECARKLAVRSASLSGLVLRCTSLPGKTGVRREASVAWCRAELSAHVAAVFAEEGELPEHLP